MKYINLNAIIAKGHLSVLEVAKHLFPKAKYPKMALSRILTGEALLDASQISKLSMLYGVDISELFESTNTWEHKNQGIIHRFINGDFLAEFSFGTGRVKVYHKDSIFHDELIFANALTIAEFVAKLDTIIETFEK
jgi:hypothetical protein